MIIRKLEWLNLVNFNKINLAKPISSIDNFSGGPKTKFLRRFFSAVRRPPIRPPKKNFS